jgi:hypothetical protein
VDVGANEGNYIADVLATNANAQGFAFEPHPATYARLLAVSARATPWLTGLG